MGLRQFYIFYSFSTGIDFYSEVDPRTERVKNKYVSEKNLNGFSFVIAACQFLTNKSVIWQGPTVLRGLNDRRLVALHCFRTILSDMEW